MAEGALAVSERVNYDVRAASGNTGRSCYIQTGTAMTSVAFRLLKKVAKRGELSLKDAMPDRISHGAGCGALKIVSPQGVIRPRSKMKRGHAKDSAVPVPASCSNCG